MILERLGIADARGQMQECAEVQFRTFVISYDHLVGERDERRGHVEAELFRGL